MPWCPKCKSEYREGFTRCSDCFSDLVESLPEDNDENDEASLTDMLFDENNVKVTPQKRAKILIPSQYHQSLINVTAFLIVYVKCFEIIKEVLNEIEALFYNFSATYIIYYLFLPVLANLVFFMGCYAILNQVGIRKYLTKKNILINISLTLSLSLISELSVYAYSFFPFNPQMASGFYYLGRLVNIDMLSRKLVPVLIYILTVQKVSLKRILLTKMAGCFYLFMVLMAVASALYYAYISSGMTIMADSSFFVIRLYLLWFGVMTSKEREEPQSLTNDLQT